ncbi:hypothetical protein FY136_28595 (plasmid) [Agrobacterium tumefaciens]|uniref:hypothetical protein n=1 Tax=Agrobacterium tumefaciens TaxID=358 RepID=UPI0021CE039D|nr:hypothetical protein [Agrobacterium tumefaciens]UXT53223.1 hypothetical protein FY136_28595 [Agrobacterium tumefaciens]
MSFFGKFFSRSSSGTGHEQIVAQVVAMEKAMNDVSPYAANAAKETGDKLRSLVSSQPDQFRKLLVDEGMSAGNIVAAMAAQDADQLLSSGQLHIYRGVLSERGKGYLAVFRYCLKNMVATGHMEQEYATELDGNLQEAIREVG